MKNKKSIMTFSAIQILIYHLWIYLLKNNEIEIFLKQSTYIGVDIFFLISAYSLGSRDIVHYGKFLLLRFKRVYIKYVIFTIIASVYFHWEITKVIQVLSGAELYKKGGGSFLWFLPTIMIFYILFPIFQKCDKKNRLFTLVVITFVWVIGTICIKENNSLYHLAIIWNRIPIFIIGYYICENNKTTKILDNKAFKIAIGITLTIVGYILIWKYGGKVKLQTPIKDMFYIIGIPATVGITFLISFIPEIKPIKWIGSSTLELYAIQMIFGYDIAGKVLYATKNKVLTNIISIVSCVIIAVLLHYMYEYIENKIEWNLKYKKEVEKR